MPVTRISCSTLISTNSGASAWIAANLQHEREGNERPTWIPRIPYGQQPLPDPEPPPPNPTQHHGPACSITHCFVVMGPLSSMGSPMTFMILPKVSGPTGMRMGAPESNTFCPLTSPSVPSMAMVRTVFSPTEGRVTAVPSG